MAVALDGIRVLELASYVTGPYAGVLLGDLGAEVIKIEEPGTGDPFRGWGEGGYSPTFCSLNRNKKSVTLDLRSEQGREALEGLIDTADVLIENFRPGVAERRGFGYADVHLRNPHLVYCSISGFGSSGPYRDRPGYDTVGQAMSGLLSLLTDLDEPKGMGISLSDHLTGLFACYGILGALMARERTGEGQLVETSLLQATIAFTAENAARYFADGKVPNRAARTRLAGVFAFRGSDGNPFVIHLSSPPRFWDGVLKAIERPDLGEDERFKTRPARQAHHAELVAELDRVFSTQPREVWLGRLLANDVPAAPLNTMRDVFDDPQVQHLGMRVGIEHPEKGRIEMVGPGVTLDNTPLRLRTAPPTLGEHNDEILPQAVSRQPSALKEIV
jgi:crotonobetainyl-CoA:carnitine CoA-transferase CaiB-like acyl-CoA transferase